MEKNTVKMYLTAFGLPFLMMSIIEILYQMGYEIISGIILAIIFAVLGILAATVSFTLYKHLTYKKGIPMVSFLLNPERLEQEVRFLFYAAVIGAIGCSIYIGDVLLFILKFDIPEPILYTLSDSFNVSTIIFALACILAFYSWIQRLKKYE